MATPASIVITLQNASDAAMMFLTGGTWNADGVIVFSPGRPGR